MLIKVSKAIVSNYEKNIHEPNMDTVKFLAELFDCSVDYLMGRTNDRQETIFEGEKIPPELRELDVKMFSIVGNDLSEDELSEIKKFAEYIKSKRNN